jgi:hypothetical protein
MNVLKKEIMNSFKSYTKAYYNIWKELNDFFLPVILLVYFNVVTKCASGSCNRRGNVK